MDRAAAQGLLNITANDGTRQFAILPQRRNWHVLRDHLSGLLGAKITKFLTDGVTEAWLDFTYRGHSFTVNDQFGEYWFFVEKPDCPDDILLAIVQHCRRLLTNPQKADALAIQDAVRKALMQDWDPIGVNGCAGAEDEYDSYIGSVLDVLNSSRSEKDLIDLLNSIETRAMGLRPTPPEKRHKAARRLLALDLGSPRTVHPDLPVPARYRLGMLEADTLVQEAIRWMSEGRDSPALTKLAILESPLSPPTLQEVSPLFEQACRELKVEIPTKDQALYQLIRLHLESISSGSRLPYEGLRLLMREVYWPHLDQLPVKKYVGDSHGLEHLIGMYWNYDDLMEPNGPPNWKNQKKNLAELDQETRKLAQAWLLANPVGS